MSQPLDNDIKFLTGVGEARANLLRTELGIRTVGDLLRHYPYRYIDRTRFYRIGEIRDDSLSYIQLRARITGFQHAGGGAKKRFVAHRERRFRHGRTGLVQRNRLDRKAARNGP